MEQYFDKHGNEIKANMHIKHDDGDIEKVYAVENEDGEISDLGLNASNENHISFNEFNRKVYPLHQFDLREWEISEGA